MPNESLLWDAPPAALPMQAALDAANVRLALAALAHAPVLTAPPAPRLARDLVAWGRIKLKPEGAALLADGMTSQAFFETLLEHNCLADARRILAHALPKRRALWWASLAARHACEGRMTEALASVLRAVSQYVVDPCEDRRRAAGEFAKRTPPNTIAGCLATAAFFSEGSVSPSGFPAVAPRPFVTGRLVGVAVYLSSVTIDPACYKQYLREYLQWGRAIAAGEMLWEQEPVENSRLAPYWPRQRSPHSPSADQARLEERSHALLS
jgi:hypothetical protein